MQALRFGIAGLKNTTDIQGSLAAVVAGGYAALEVQFVKEFTLKEEECRLLGALAREHGVALSVHAPYFAALTTKDPERLRLHVGALHHACNLAAAMGATVVVCHPGSAEGDSQEVHERIDTALEMIAPRVADLGVKLGLETPGRKSQFGSLGDIALVVARHPFTTPVIDFAHIHAVSGGSLRGAAAFEALFGYILDQFSGEHLWPLHCHFTDNRFGPAGEIAHVPYGEGSLRAAHLVEGFGRFDLALTIISEERWATSHAAIREELRAAGAPLIEPGGERVRLPGKLPVEPKGEAHVYRSGRRELRITNIEKPYFPDDGITKGDLIDYYYRMAPLMLPFLRDRPIVMQRVPEGIHGEAFYEKQAPKGAPEWLRTVPVDSEGGRKTIDYVVVDDTATLLWLAQIGSVECHAWTSRWPDLDQPDFAVIDLDPHEPVTFEEVCTVGKLVKVVLDRVGLRGFPKTSGGSGLQIFIPLTPGHSYAEVREFCTSVGRLIRQAYPERATLEPQIPKRAGKVFIDANQNAKGKTLVAPYSVRPYPGATVSTPLFWEELDEEFYPEQFTISSVLERVAEGPDPFRPALVLRQDLHPALGQLGGGVG